MAKPNHDGPCNWVPMSAKPGYHKCSYKDCQMQEKFNVQRKTITTHGVGKRGKPKKTVEQPVIRDVTKYGGGRKTSAGFCMLYMFLIPFVLPVAMYRAVRSLLRK